MEKANDVSIQSQQKLRKMKAELKVVKRNVVKLKRKIKLK